MKFLYHANCIDGAGAALAAWIRHGDKGHSYIPVQYGSDPIKKIRGQDIYILDFSYDRKTILDMAIEANSITIIDHHKTAKEELSEPFTGLHKEQVLCGVEVIFDMKKSGARLSWEYFNPGKDVPMLINYIEDYDLWASYLGFSKQVHVALQCEPDWKQWERYIVPVVHKKYVSINTLINKGCSILEFLEAQSKIIINTKPQKSFMTDDYVPMYNIPGFMASNTLSMALDKYKDSPYAVGFFDLKDRRVFSLRSRSESDVDVSQIAKIHGGGGHKHSAGFVKKFPLD